MNNNKFNAQNKAIETYLLSGKLRCGICGASMIVHTSHSGRNKTKYSTYYCGERYRTKNCNQKPINKTLIESIAMTDLREKLFNPQAIQLLANKLIAHHKKTKQEDTKDIQSFKKNLGSIQKKLDNIIAAITDGLYNPSMKTSMDSLEKEKATVLIMISETETRARSSTLDKSMIIAYLEKEIELLENKNPDDLKKIIQTYIEKIIVYEERIEVFLIFIVHTNGGGEGTPFKLKTFVIRNTMRRGQMVLAILHQ